MTREIQETGTDEYGAETHPAFGVAVVNRFSSGPPGATFFDSEIQHQHGVVLTIYGATRKRDLHTDWVHHTGLPLIEVQMSQSQWGALVSSFGDGSGTPVTITATENDYNVPGLPYSPRMAMQVAETREAAREGSQKVQEALARYKAADGAKAKREAMSYLQAMIDNLPSNLAFAEKQLAEHVETTVNKAKADIEAMVASHARYLGIDPAAVTAPLQLGAAEPKCAVCGSNAIADGVCDVCHGGAE